MPNAPAPSVDGDGARAVVLASGDVLTVRPEVPRDTTPTFELEMLVSGAVLFGLLQLPPILTGVVRRWSPHVDVVGLFFVQTAGMLVGAAVYALIMCFVLHLAIRSYWVALVGVNSVFPGGMQWERMREYGPIQTELQRRRVRPLPAYIARADNTATLVFATGFILATSTLTSLAVMGVLGAVLMVAVRLFGVGSALWVIGGLTLVFGITVWSAVGMDYARGARLDPNGVPARAIRRIVGGVSAVMPGGVRSLSAVLTSNVEKRVAIGAMFTGLLLATGLSFADSVNADAGLPAGGAYRFFRDDAPGALAADAYANLRGDGEASVRAPWIDADVVTVPYLRLYVPYRIRAHNDALARACPGLRVLDGDAADSAVRHDAEEVLRCAARVHRVAIDGRPVESLQFRLFADPRSNRRVFLAHVDVASLASGEHLLTVWPARSNTATGPARAYEIPFWR